MNKRQKFDAKFRAQAVDLAEMSDRPRYEVASDLGISDASLSRWMAKHKNNASPDDLSESERDELKRLRKEKREWAMEREIVRVPKSPRRTRRWRYGRVETQNRRPDA